MVEQRQLAVQQLRVVDGQLAAGRRVLGDELPAVLGGDVEPGDQRAASRRARPSARLGVGVGRCGVGPPGASTRSPTTSSPSSPAGSSRSRAAPASTWAFDHGQDLADPPGDRRPHRRLHLHALEHDDRLAGLDLVPDRDPDGDDDGGRRRADHALLVPRDAVGDAVHLDQVRRGRRDWRRPVARGADGEPALERAEPVHGDVDVRAVDLDPVAVRGRPCATVSL